MSRSIHSQSRLITKFLGSRSTGSPASHRRPSIPSRSGRASSSRTKIWSLHPPSGSGFLTIDEPVPMLAQDAAEPIAEVIEHSLFITASLGHRPASRKAGDWAAQGAPRPGAGWCGSLPAGLRQVCEGRSWRPHLVRHPLNPVPKVWIAGFRIVSVDWALFRRETGCRLW